jgi:hypothetical protein
MLTPNHYSLALASQSACNMSGITIAFAEALKAMCKAGLDTDARNKHPISILYAVQIAHLAGIGDGASMAGYAQAVAACERGMEEGKANEPAQ